MGRRSRPRDTRRLARCTKSGWYYSREEAEEALAAIWANPGYIDHQPQRAYPCRHHRRETWHLTSRWRNSE